MLDKLPFIMIRCLFLTIIIELLVAIFLKVKDKKDILNIILVNIMTNPIVVTIPVYINLIYGIMARHVSLLLFEILTVIVEGFVYTKYLNYKKLNGYILSLILNLTTYLFGEILNIII